MISRSEGGFNNKGQEVFIAESNLMHLQRVDKNLLFWLVLMFPWMSAMASGYGEV